MLRTTIVGERWFKLRSRIACVRGGFLRTYRSNRDELTQATASHRYPIARGVRSCLAPGISSARIFMSVSLPCRIEGAKRVDVQDKRHKAVHFGRIRQNVLRYVMRQRW